MYISIFNLRIFDYHISIRQWTFIKEIIPGIEDKFSKRKGVWTSNRIIDTLPFWRTESEATGNMADVHDGQLAHSQIESNQTLECRHLIDS